MGDIQLQHQLIVSFYHFTRFRYSKYKNNHQHPYFFYTSSNTSFILAGSSELESYAVSSHQRSVRRSMVQSRVLFPSRDPLSAAQ